MLFPKVFYTYIISTSLQAIMTPIQFSTPRGEYRLIRVGAKDETKIHLSLTPTSRWHFFPQF